jgi:hypothetical protein
MIRSRMIAGLALTSIVGAQLASGVASACPGGGGRGYARPYQARRPAYTQPDYTQPVYPKSVDAPPAAPQPVIAPLAAAPKPVAAPVVQPAAAPVTGALPALNSVAQAKGASYAVEIQYPGNYHDNDWHQIDSFPSKQNAEKFAALLRGNLKSEPDVQVRVVKK